MGILDFLASPQDRFAKLFLRRLHQFGASDAIYDKQAFAVLWPDGSAFSLERAFAEWRRCPPGMRDAAVHEMAAAALDQEPEGGFDELARLFLPVVRPRRALLANADAKPPFRDVAGPLAVTVAMDLPHSLKFLNEQSLLKWDRAFEQVLDRAIGNLRAQEAKFELQEGGFYALDHGSVFASSRLLQTELFEDLAFKGPPIAMVPERNVVLVADSEDPKALEEMAGIGASVVQGSLRPIAFTPLILLDGQWRVFEPAPEASLAVRRLPILQRVFEYAEQHDGLEAAVQARGEDLFIAKLDATERDGQILTHTTWTDDVATLLPKAETLILHDAQWRSLQRRWEDVETVCGAFVQEPDLDPPRYRTGQPISAVQWERLRAEFPSPNGWPELE